jgi:hypothetical protein
MRFIGLFLLSLVMLVTAPTEGLGMSSGAALEAPAPVTAAAHELGQGYFFFRVYEDSLVVRLEITTRDLNTALGFGWDLDQGVDEAAVRSALDAIRAYVEPRMSVAIAGEALDLVYHGFDVRFLEVADFVQLHYSISETTGIPDLIDVTYPILFEVDPQHRNFLVVEHNWQTGTFSSEAIVGIFSPREPTQSLDLSSSNALRGFVAMIKQGVWHIWIGLDHILFLVALILPAVLVREEGAWQPVPSFKKALYNIVGIVSFFTLAHTVTLSLAALELISLPPKLVESIIAGSIAVAAWANLVPKLSIREAAIAFAFGLFHGFGFASVLSDIGLGREHLVLSLLGFNIGVELGQIAIICAIFPVLFLLRKQRVYMWILKFGSIALIAIALLWVFERVFEFNVPIGSTVRSVLGVG